MSVLDPVIDHLDPATKRIYLAAGVREYHPVADVYTEVRNLRRTNEVLRQYQMPVTAAGNVPKGGGKYTPRYIVLQNGWRIVPDDVSHVLYVTGEQLTAEGGAGAACMDLTPLSPSSKVVIQYEPPAAEIIYVSGGGGLTKADVDAAVWTESAQGAQVAMDATKARMGVTNSKLLYPSGRMSVIGDDGVTEAFRFMVTGPNGEQLNLQAGIPARIVRIP